MKDRPVQRIVHIEVAAEKKRPFRPGTGFKKGAENPQYGDAGRARIKVARADNPLVLKMKTEPQSKRKKKKLPERLIPYQFKPGHAPLLGAGRPKGSGTTKLVESYTVLLSEPCCLPGLEELTWAEAIALGLAGRAAMGDYNAARELREATEGKAMEHHEITAKNAVPFQPPRLVVNFVGVPDGSGN